MPFWKSKKSSADAKGRPPLTAKEKKTLLGLKVIQAQQNPEPIYDLSDCETSTLPDDTYTFCKLLNKTTLNISGNALSNLDNGESLSNLANIEVINASENKIDKLSSEISSLTKLRILNLSHNKLKSLPDSFKYLSNLQQLILSHNRYSTVPPSICALPRLQILNLTNNDISSLPTDLCNLQSSLHTLDFDIEKIQNISSEILSQGFQNIMKYLCSIKGVNYVGPNGEGELIQPKDDSISEQQLSSSPGMDDIMLEYIRKKQAMLQSQIQTEEKLRLQEQQQLEDVLQSSSKNKVQILADITDSPNLLEEYNLKKQEKLDEQMKLEESFRANQEDELGAYLNNTSTKESLLMNISAQEENIQQEVESIIVAREKEKSRLLSDLSSAQQATDSALYELLNVNQTIKVSDFVELIKDQEEKMQQLLHQISECSADVRRTEIIDAMQNDLMKELSVQLQQQKIEEKKNSWVSSVVNDEVLESAHLELVLKNKTSAQNDLVANLLEDAQYQAEAFKLLLLKNDLKRNSVIRQIAQVEYELARLSSLEVRKKKCGLKYGSTTMLNQRKTLVGLLYSLFKARDERDKELNDWFCDISNHNSDVMSTEDFWLLQYQRLMLAKPDNIASAESAIDEEVHEILCSAHALDLLPLFAKHEISYSQLLDMSEEDYSSIGIGSATYYGIQRALNVYLNKTKIGPQEPSAPPESLLPDAPSAPPEEPSDAASAPPLETAYIESECVVCLSKSPCIIFLPCGHICSCADCCQSLATCPMCRVEVTSKCFIQEF